MCIRDREMGATEEHCATCAALDGLVAYAVDWERSGVKPQNPPNGALECGGWRCDCSLVPTKERATNNAFDEIVDRVTAAKDGEKSLKANTEGGHWVTINGDHVFIDENGVPQNAPYLGKDKKPEESIEAAKEKIYNAEKETGYIFDKDGNVIGIISGDEIHVEFSKENLDRGSIILGKVLYPDFLNHVKIAVRVTEFEWAENYIEKFKHLLSEEKDGTLTFCHGIISYKKGDTDKALDLLSRTNFPDFIIKIQVKILLLQINYEKEYYEQALMMIDSFRHYLQRERSIPDESKEFFFDFLKLTNDLIKLKIDVDPVNKKFELLKLKEITENMKFNQFGIKIWLNEKILDL